MSFCSRATWDHHIAWFWAQVVIVALMARVNYNNNTCLCHGGPLRFIDGERHAWGSFTAWDGTADV